MVKGDIILELSWFTPTSVTSILTKSAITCNRRHSTKLAIKFSTMTIVQREFCALRQRQIPVLLSLVIFIVPSYLTRPRKIRGKGYCANAQ